MPIIDPVVVTLAAGAEATYTFPEKDTVPDMVIPHTATAITCTAVSLTSWTFRNDGSAAETATFYGLWFDKVARNTAHDFTPLLWVGRQGAAPGTVVRTDQDADADDLAYWKFDEPYGAATVINYGPGGSAFDLTYAYGTAGTPGYGDGGDWNIPGSAGMLGRELRSTGGQDAEHRAYAYGAGGLQPDVFTVSAWVRPDWGQDAQLSIILKPYRDTASWTAPFSAVWVTAEVSSQWRAYVTAAATRNTLVVGDVVQEGVGMLRAGLYHHLGVTYDGTTWRSYLDGCFVASMAVAGPMDWGAGNAPWYIAANRYNSTPDKFAGGIRSVKVAQVVRPESWFRTVWQKGIGFPIVSAA